MPVDHRALAGAWLDARWTEAAVRRRPALQHRQQRLWARLQPTIARTPAIAALAGRPLGAFPVTTPQAMRADFANWNTLGLTTAEVEGAARAAEGGEDGEVRPGVVAGYSTGTSGSRGVFLSTPVERGLYLGHALARLLSTSALLGGPRVALCLRADNRLYGDVAATGRVRFRHFGLDLPADERRRALEAFGPDVLIAPSHVLAELARAGARLNLRRLFYGAESMGEAERGWIGERLGVRPDPIYQATEGFIGCACRLGTLHLNEDVLVVELEPTSAAGCFRPIVTDLRRTSQPMVRVRLDDLIEPLESPCPCGSPRRAVRGVAGRVDDLWTWGETVVTPRMVTEAVEGVASPDVRWIAAASPDGVRVGTEPEQAETIVAAVSRLLRARGVSAPVAAEPLATIEHPKRRRVRWRHA